MRKCSLSARNTFRITFGQIRTSKTERPNSNIKNSCEEENQHDTQSIIHPWRTGRVGNSEVHLLLLRLGMDGTSNRRSFVVYALAILLWSPPSDPVPFLHAAAERTRLTVIGVYG